jgi:hypothetical protein
LAVVQRAGRLRTHLLLATRRRAASCTSGL